MDKNYSFHSPYQLSQPIGIGCEGFFDGIGRELTRDEELIIRFVNGNAEEIIQKELTDAYLQELCNKFCIYRMNCTQDTTVNFGVFGMLCCKLYDVAKWLQEQYRIELEDEVGLLDKK